MKKQYRWIFLDTLNVVLLGKATNQARFHDSGDRFFSWPKAITMNSSTPIQQNWSFCKRARQQGRVLWPIHLVDFLPALVANGLLDLSSVNMQIISEPDVSSGIRI